MNFEWISSDGVSSQQETGTEDLKVTITDQRMIAAASVMEITYLVERKDGYGLRHRDDMYLELFARICATWTMLDQKNIKKHNGDPKYIESIMRMEMEIPSNQKGGFSLFPCIRVPGERELPIPPKDVIAGYRTWDIKYWRCRFGVIFTSGEWYSIWKEVRLTGRVIYDGLPWEQHGFSVPVLKSARVPNLKILCMRKLSWHNLAFTGDENGPYSVHAVADLYPLKLPKMVEKFNKKTKVIDEKIKSLEGVIPEGLNLLYYALGTRPAFKSQVWDHDTALEKAIDKCSKHTSAGLRAGPRHETKLYEVRLVASVCGKKMEQLPYATRQIRRTKEEILRDPMYIPQDSAAQVTLKDEFYNKHGLPPKEAKELPQKLRPYYILSLFQYLMAAMCMGFRQLVERGRVIKIGMSFWYGGATAFAMGMSYDDPDMIFEDGDFRHLDTSIHMILLMLYSTQAYVYYDWEAMTTENVILLKAFFRICAERLSIKVTHLFSTIWRVIYGGMPSGAYETSHGDSWIVAFLYYLYVAQVIQRYPDRAIQIRNLLRLYRIGIVVYGDDHVMFTHKDVHDIINEAGYARFVHDYWNMHIRDIHRSFFFSKINNYTGLIKEPGIVFLKRYFVRREDVFTQEEIEEYEMSPVLPYRPLGALIMKYAYGKADEKSIIEYVVSAIGMAFDTQGTNKIAYDFCEHMYNSVSRLIVGKIPELLKEFIERVVREGKDTYITRLMRTASLTSNDIIAGFPTWESLIARHKYNIDYVRFGSMKGFKPEVGRESPF